MLRATMERAPVIACRMKLASASCTRSPQPSAFRRSFVADPAFGSFRLVLAHFKGVCPAPRPVVVRSSWLPAGTLGECVRRPEKFVIRLSDELDEQMAVETLCHEWAHALAWNYALDAIGRMPDPDPEQFEAEAHGEAWGCAYSRVWRAYLTLGL
jgi:hypothetical protein